MTQRLLNKLLPKRVDNWQASGNLDRFLQAVKQCGRPAKVLVVGGATLGAGMSVLLKHGEIELVETDIWIGPRTQVACDAHDLPFANDTFHGCIMQAILDDVLDPAACVKEVHRVLTNKGVVYAETPFLYPVHDGRQDLQRFTHLGHRWLFRGFEEIFSGPTAGPATTLAVTFESFAISCFESRVLRVGARVFARAAVWWMKYMDRYLTKKAGAYDCAVGYYFIGTKSLCELASESLPALYRGQEFNVRKQ